jgi:hypothetical protein
VDISFKDDVTVILLLGVSFMLCTQYIFIIHSRHERGGKAEEIIRGGEK